MTNEPVNYWRVFAMNDPALLLARMRSGELDNASLSFAAESLGYADKTPEIRRALVELLLHPSPVVREGALYGLNEYEDVSELYGLVESDPSSAIRMIAAAMVKS